MATEMATSTVPVTATTSSSSGDLSAGTEDATIGHIVSLALPALVVVLSDPLQTLVGIEGVEGVEGVGGVEGVEH